MAGKIELDADTVGDILGTIAVGSIAWTMSGGEKLPLIGDFLPFIASAAAAFVTWKLVRKNN